MIKSYIYGTPHGFNFYEGIKSFDEYFKSFYVSSRKGSRLMIHRQNNGMVFYNYLHYGLTEIIGRPNSFFGMSLSVDDGKYCADFDQLFNWFELVFNTIVQRGKILHFNEGGKIQYCVDKFDDAHNEIEWLKATLPNIFNKETFPDKAVGLIPLDSSFKDDKGGIIKCFNNQTPNTKIIKTFKLHRWLAISSIFPIEEEAFELDLLSIEGTYSGYNQEILPIAITPQESFLPILNEFAVSCKKIISDLEKYCKSVEDKKELEKGQDLIIKYNDLQNNISSLINKIDSHKPQPLNSKKCVKCHNERPLSMFEEGGDICNNCIIIPPSIDSKKCKNCQQDLPLSMFNTGSVLCNNCIVLPPPPPIDTRFCPKCKKERNKSEFIVGNEFCKECRNSHQIFAIFKWLKKTRSTSEIKLLVIFMVISIFMAIAGILIFYYQNSRGNDPSNDPNIYTEQTSNSDEIQTTIDDSQIDSILFAELIRTNEYDKIIDHISGKVDEDYYKKKLQNHINSEIWHLIDYSNLKEIEENISDFIIKNHKAMDYLNISYSNWEPIIIDYKKIIEITKKNKISNQEKEKGLKLVAKLPPEMQDIYKNLIEQLPIKELAEVNTPITIIIEEKDNKNNLIRRVVVDKETKYTGQMGNFITISTSEGKIEYIEYPNFQHSRPNEKTVKIKLKQGGSHYYKCKGIKITIVSSTKIQ